MSQFLLTVSACEDTLRLGPFILNDDLSMLLLKRVLDGWAPGG